MGKIEEALKLIAGKRTYIDTNLFIYFFAANPKYEFMAKAFIEAARDREFFAVTGKAVVAEVMVRAYRNGNPEIIAGFKAFFADNFIEVVDHPNDLFEKASLYAGTRRMKLIDAIHYTTALHAGCEGIISSDQKFTKQRETMEVINLDALLPNG